MIYARLEDGSDLFLRMDWIRSCAKCIRRNQENKCRHIEPRPSHFEPRGALRRQKALITPFGTQAYETELLNQAAANNRTPVFRSEWLQPLRDGTNDWPSAQWNPHVPLGDFEEFFVGIDPAGGGFSRLILLANIIDRTRASGGAQYQCVVVACEAVGKLLIEMDLGDIIVDFALQVRATIPGLRHARAIICIESNSILVPHSIVGSIQRNSRATNMGYMCESAAAPANPNGLIDVRPGTRTTNRSKEAIVSKVRDLLVAGTLCFHRQFFIPHPEQQAPGEENVKVGRELFIEELGNFCMEVIQPTGPVAKQQRPHVRYHGVRASSNQAANDDRLMALGFCLQCEPLYRANRQLFVHIVQQGPGGMNTGHHPPPAWMVRQAPVYAF